LSLFKNTYFKNIKLLFSGVSFQTNPINLNSKEVYIILLLVICVFNLKCNAAVANVTPQMFGAVGNGLTDDTVSIKKAIAAAGEGGVIDFGNKTKVYSISEILKLQKNQKIIAKGAIIRQIGTKLFVPSITDPIPPNSNPSSSISLGVPIFDCTDLSSVEISGLEFQTKDFHFFNSSSSWHVAIMCSGAQNLVIKDNKFIGFTYAAVSSEISSSGAGIPKPVTHFLFRNNKVLGAPQRVFYKVNPDGTIGTNFEMRNCTAVTVGGNNISIVKNTILGLSDEVNFASLPPDAFIIPALKNNRIRYALAQGFIIAQRSKEVILSENSISGIYIEHGIYIDKGVSNLEISNNSLKNISKMGIKVQNNDDDGGPYTCENITIIRNRINKTSTGGDGISILNTTTSPKPIVTIANNVTVSDNTISNIGQYGINVRSAKNSKVSNNAINDIAFYGIYCSNNKDVLFSSNLITNCIYSGIWDDNTGGGQVIYANNYINNIGLGKSTDDNVGSLSGIFIAHQKNSGNRIIMMNTVIGSFNTTYGLFIEGGDLSQTEIKANTFVNNKDYAIRLPSSTVLLNNSSLKYFGENVLEAGHNSVKKNLVLNGAQNVQRRDIDKYLETKPPTTGNWVRGTVIFNKSKKARSIMGWVCITSGSPGIWKSFGANKK
jgi:Right handed beta helix region